VLSNRQLFHCAFCHFSENCWWTLLANSIFLAFS